MSVDEIKPQPQDVVYVVRDGEVLKLNPPNTGYGHNNIVWIGGKVDRVDSTESRKI
ncbi:DUF3954 domain-containing protein [Salicibibacter kimchii]|uniref:DUF3954 domain-containing protein n=1 Tax=Salicibibacter kimchii TaxID=2099786 RepID=A0A345C3L0_9BACI|nr:DUF3954 domain-containing protein [Salicibibacter kimchii]AXF57791.1 DUF3954 domain-containing protein [Salicibibacter kimchii]